MNISVSDGGRRVEGKAGVDWYQVNEIFTSIQGEGVHTGIPSTFIRLQGCTVGCWWCDSGPLADELEAKRTTNGETRNTWAKGGKRMSVADIVAQVHTPQVIITGGEPTLWDLDALMWAIRDKDPDAFITLETSGQNELKGVSRPDWITWSPKQNLNWQAPGQIFSLANEVKWVVDDKLPWEVVWDTWMRHSRRFNQDPYAASSPGSARPWYVLMPEGCPPKQESVNKCLSWLESLPMAVKLNWRFGDRLQYRLGVR